MAKRGGVQAFMSFFAFAAIIMIGLALLIAAVLPSSANDVSNALIVVANVFAYIVVAFYSYFFAFANRRHRIIYIIVWVIAITLIVLHYILGMI